MESATQLNSRKSQLLIKNRRFYSDVQWRIIWSREPLENHLVRGKSPDIPSSTYDYFEYRCVAQSCYHSKKNDLEQYTAYIKIHGQNWSDRGETWIWRDVYSSEAKLLSAGADFRVESQVTSWVLYGWLQSDPTGAFKVISRWFTVDINVDFDMISWWRRLGNPLHSVNRQLLSFLYRLGDFKVTPSQVFNRRRYVAWFARSKERLVTDRSPDVKSEISSMNSTSFHESLAKMWWKTVK